jgi:transcriptional regulator NrdR family protein
MIKVIKKDGTREEYNVEKVIAAISKSASRALISFNEEELQKIREKVMEEMKDGVVVLPHYLKAITSDMDNIVFTE